MREISLIDYLPLFIQNYVEIQRIMNAENPEFQALWETNEQIRKNLFILTADEIGINRYERLLNIFPLLDDTIESRRARILIRMNEQLPYTLRGLKNQLEAVCEDENFEIDLDADNYTLKIRLELFSSNTADDIAELLKRICPANLICIVSNDTVQITFLHYLGAMFQSITHNMDVSVDLTETFERSTSGTLYTPMNNMVTEHIKQAITISI